MTDVVVEEVALAPTLFVVLYVGLASRDVELPKRNLRMRIRTAIDERGFVNERSWNALPFAR
jgi:hypothetical protein